MKPKEKVLAPVHPNQGVEASYRRRLIALIDEMHAAVDFWVKAAYRANGPAIAMDATPTDVLAREMVALRDRWLDRFDQASRELAAYFALDISQRSDAALKSILARAGISVAFRMTPAQEDILQAMVQQNVALIKSIPEQYLTQVQGAVMRSVQTGRDIGGLSAELQDHFGVAKRRAALIARSQNEMATSALNRARQLELGITQAIWVHSGGGKEPRPTHVAASQSQTRFDVARGWFDPNEGKWIQPGELINCRCVARSIIPGFI